MHKLAAEMWETIEGGEPPANFFKIIESYMRYKSVLVPAPFTSDDFAVCMMLYKLTKAITSKKTTKKAEQPEGAKEASEEEAMEQTKEEQKDE